MLTPADGSTWITRLEEGVDRFNAGRFWDAHESWEELWLGATGSDRRFLQGLIQLAAAYHHVSRGTLRGAERLLKAAVSKLEALPGQYGGVDLEDAIAVAMLHLRELGDVRRISDIAAPKLRYNRDLSSTVGYSTKTARRG